MTLNAQQFNLEDFGVTGYRSKNFRQKYGAPAIPEPKDYPEDQVQSPDYPYSSPWDTDTGAHEVPADVRKTPSGGTSWSVLGRQGTLFSTHRNSSYRAEREVDDTLDTRSWAAQHELRHSSEQFYYLRDGEEPGTSREVPEPAAEAEYNPYHLANNRKYVLTVHHTGALPVVNAWHNGRRVGSLVQAYEEPSDEPAQPTGTHSVRAPAGIAVDPEHRNAGLGRAMFRMAQAFGPFQNPVDNMRHSEHRTPNGHAYSERVPDDPFQDPTRATPLPNGRQLSLWED
jgi:GNAT superfamily N-acetyltransferase